MMTKPVYNSSKFWLHLNLGTGQKLWKPPLLVAAQAHIYGFHTPPLSNFNLLSWKQNKHE